jgi:hypothetical protein
MSTYEFWNELGNIFDAVMAINIRGSFLAL